MRPTQPSHIGHFSIFPGAAMVNDDGVSVFESVRLVCFGIAYRMLGSAAEAEDIVQDAWLRWQGTDRTAW